MYRCSSLQLAAYAFDYFERTYIHIYMYIEREMCIFIHLSPRTCICILALVLAYARCWSGYRYKYMV